MIAKEQTLRRVRVQQFCYNCEEPISGLCARCSKDKTRKPKVIEIWDAPQIYKWCPCKGKVWIKCQVDPERRPKTCREFHWAAIMRDGTMRFKDHFCDRFCAGANRQTREQVICACGCGEKIWRRGSHLKKYKFAFVSTKHQWDWRYKQLQEKKKAREDLSLQDLICLNGCNGPQVHKHITGNMYECTACGKQRSAKQNFSERTWD